MSTARIISYKRRSLRSERGTGDGLTIMMVLGLCVLISVTLMILNWVKTTKDERVRDRNKTNSNEINIKRGPGGYQVEY